jgi:hypothetical protein
MSTISAISYTSPSGLQLENNDRRDPMAFVAKALGMSRSSLREALAGGKSLNDVAGDRHVSHDDLINAIKQGMPRNPNVTGDATDTEDAPDTTELAEKMAAAAGGPAPRPPARAAGTTAADDTTSGSSGNPLSSLSSAGSSGGSGACRALSDPDKLDQLASLLNMNAGQLASQATSAQSLVELLQQNNVGVERLRPFLQSGDLIDAVA